MSGTSVEHLPGGLLDRLLATEDDPRLVTVRALGAAGAYAAAGRELKALPTSDPKVAAWRRFTWHGCWLGLPDGTARPMPEIGTKLAELPSVPELGAGAGAEEWIVGRMLTAIRDTRATLSPALPLDHADLGDLASNVLPGAMRDIDEAATHAANRPDILGHLGLIAADLAARTGDAAAVAEHLRSARLHLAEADDTRGLAAAALLAGDLCAAPLTSPLSWNCVLATVLTSPNGGLPDSVEELEFMGSSARVSDAEAAYAEATALYTAANCPAGLAAVELRRGFLAILAGQTERASALIERAYNGFTGTDRPLDAAIASTHLALAAIADDRFPEDRHAADAVVLAGRHSVGQAPALGLGLLCVRIGRYWAGRGRQPERARAALRLAQRILDGLAESVLCAQTLGDIVELSAALGDLSGARNALRDAVAADPAPAGQGDPFDPGRFRRAMRHARLYDLANQARDVDGMELASQATSDMFDMLRSNMSRFGVQERLVATELLAQFDPSEHQLVILLYRVRDAQENGDSKQATDLLAQARGVLERIAEYPRLLHEALFRKVAGDDTGASAAFARYVSGELSPTSEPPNAEMAVQRHEIGLSFQLDVANRDRARAHFDAIMAAGRHLDWRLLGYKGRLLELEEDLDTAVVAMDHALADLETTRATLRRDELKQSYSANVDVQTIFLAATRIALGLAERTRTENPVAWKHWTAAAFDYAERARSRALRDLMLANASSEQAALPATLLARWRSSGAKVALAQVRRDQAEQRGDSSGPERARLEEALADQHIVETEFQRITPRFWTAVNPQAEVGDLNAVAAAIPDGTALLQFVVGRTDLLAWVVTRDGMIATHRRSGPHDIAALVTAVVNSCAAGNDEYEEPAARLTALLLDPLRPAIEGATALFVVPGGPLLRLPFALLPWNGSTLGEAAPITILPSASALLATDDRIHASGRPLVVGDPKNMVYQGVSRTELPPLPGARAEATSIADVLTGADLLTDEEATSDRVKALLPEAPVVHFATHGIADADSPLGSAVLLASGESLTAAELLEARLSADLVVLSACHTGTGAAMRGDELLGLARGLLAAGARAAIVSLWAVNDKSAALLMCEFHRLRASGLSNRDALQKATEWLRSLDATVGPDRMVRNIEPWSRTNAPYSNPHHWAPFVLVSADGHQPEEDR